MSWFTDIKNGSRAMPGPGGYMFRDPRKARPPSPIPPGFNPGIYTGSAGLVNPNPMRQTMSAPGFSTLESFGGGGMATTQGAGTPTDPGRYPWVPGLGAPLPGQPPMTGDPVAGAGQPPAAAPQTGSGLPRKSQQTITNRPQKDWTRDQVRMWVADFFAAKGIAPQGNSVDYWTDKFFSPEFNGDIDYWMGRLGQADEFTGGGKGGGGLGLDSPLLKGYGKEFSYDPNEILNSTAFKAALARGVDALQKSAAAKGTVLGGGIMKDIDEFGTTFALDAIDADFNRKLGGYETNRSTYWGDTDRQFQRLADFTRLGQSGAGQLGGYGSDYGSSTDQTAGGYADTVLNQGQADAAGRIAKGGGYSSLSSFGSGQPFDLSSITKRTQSGYGRR